MMKKQILWVSILTLGILTFIFPFLSGFYRMSIESWSMYDWVVTYSFIYWPTYLVGLLAIPLAIFNLLRHNT